MKKNEGLLLIIVLVILLRLPSLFEPAWYGDENIYLTIGQGIRKGLVLYRDITDYPNKPPLIYWLAALVRTVFGFRLLLLVWNTVHVVIMWGLLKLIAPTKPWIYYGFTLMFVLLTSLPMLEGNIANGEMFMIMPTTAAMLMLWKAESVKASERKSINYFLAGVLFGIGFLFKVPVVADMIAAGIFFLVTPPPSPQLREAMMGTARLRRAGLLNTRKFAVFIRKAMFLAVGWVGLVGLIIGFHALQGVGPLLLVREMIGNTRYVAVWQSGRDFLTLSTLPARLVMVGLITLLLLIWRKRVIGKVLFASLWAVWALFGALLSGRPYPHYLLQLVPPLMLLLASLANWRKVWANVVVVMGILLLILGTYVRFKFSVYPVLIYYPNFVAFITGNISQEEYYRRFDARMPRNYQVAAYLREHTLPNERIYVWGTEPDIYVLANRLPVGKLTTSFHVEDLDEYDRLGQELKQSKPRYIVWMDNEPRKFLKLEQLLETGYLPVNTFAEAMIYKLIPQTE